MRQEDKTNGKAFFRAISYASYLAGIFDYDDGDYAMSISDSMAMDSDGNLMMRMGDHMAMDMDTGDIHMISSWSDDDEE